MCITLCVHQSGCQTVAAPGRRETTHIDFCSFEPQFLLLLTPVIRDCGERIHSPTPCCVIAIEQHLDRPD